MDRGSKFEELIIALLPDTTDDITMLTGKGGVKNYVRAINGGKELTWRMLWVFFHTGKPI